MWNQKMKGILLALGSLCLFQNVSAEVVDGFKVEDFYETDELIYYNKKIAMFMYEGAYWKNLKTHFICSKSVSSTPYRTCFWQAKKGNYIDKKYKIQSVEMLIEFDCGANRFKKVFQSARSGSFGSGEEIMSASGDSWTSRHEAPMFQAMYAIGCVKD